MNNKRKGFTFIELIIVLAFFSIIFISIGKVMLSIVEIEKDTSLNYQALTVLESIVEGDLASFSDHSTEENTRLFQIEISHSVGHWKEYKIINPHTGKVYSYEIFTP